MQHHYESHDEGNEMHDENRGLEDESGIYFDVAGIAGRLKSALLAHERTERQRGAGAEVIEGSERELRHGKW